MANPSKRAGTDGENYVAERMQAAGLDVARVESGRRPGEDVEGFPFPIEVRRRKVLAIPDWTRKLTTRFKRGWILVALPRDKRRKDAHPELLIVPLGLGIEFMKAWLNQQETR